MMRRLQLDGSTALLDALNPGAVLARGYAIVEREQDGRLIFSVAESEPGTRLRTVLQDGSIDSVVAAVASSPAVGAARPM